MRRGSPKNRAPVVPGDSVRANPQRSAPGTTHVPAQAFFLLVIALCVGLSAHPISSKLDTWAHAAVGKWIWEHKQVPDHALYLWSSTEPWVAHSWLSQLTFYALASIEGDESEAWFLRLFTVAMTTTPFVLIWRLWGKQVRPAAWAVIMFSLGLHCSSTRFQPRPELFTAVFLTILLLFLYRRTATPTEPAGKGRLKRELVRGAGIVAMFVAWTNAHGGVAVGLAILAATAVCDLIQDRFDRRSLTLAGLTIICGASTLINPFGVSYWEILRPTNNEVFASIVEWWPVWRAPAVAVDRLLAVGLLFAAAVATWVRSPRRRWSQLAWLIGTGAALLSARRHMWLLSLVSLTVLAAHADSLAPQKWWEVIHRALMKPAPEPTGARSDSGKDSAPVSAERGIVPVALWVGLLLLVSWMSPDWAPPAARPDQAARFLQEKHTGGRVLNFYEGSSYLQWRLTGNPPLFIDLLNAYPDQVMLDLREFVLFTPRGRVLLDEMQIDWVILTASVPNIPELPLVQFLMRSRDWAVVYRDEAAIIWVRRTAATEPVWRTAPK
jgi:hypothetical protein